MTAGPPGTTNPSPPGFKSPTALLIYDQNIVQSVALSTNFILPTDVTPFENDLQLHPLDAVPPPVITDNDLNLHYVLTYRFLNGRLRAFATVFDVKDPQTILVDGSYDMPTTPTLVSVAQEGLTVEQLPKSTNPIRVKKGQNVQLTLIGLTPQRECTVPPPPLYPRYFRPSPLTVTGTLVHVRVRFLNLSASVSFARGHLLGGGSRRGPRRFDREGLSVPEQSRPQRHIHTRPC